MRPVVLDELEVVDPPQARRLAHGPLGRLLGERVAGAAAVVLEVDPAGEVLVEHGPGLAGPDAAEVEALRQEDDVAGEAVAADVGGLPDPVLVGLLGERLVERAAVARAAAVVLAVRADEQQRVAERLAGRGQVEPEQVLVAVELGAEERAAALGRAAPEDGETRPAAALRAPDEEELRARARGAARAGAPSPGRRARCRRARRGPRGRGTRRGSSGRRGWRWRRAARRSRSETSAAELAAYAPASGSGDDDADHLAGADDRLPGDDREPGDDSVAHRDAPRSPSSSPRRCRSPVRP